MLHQDLAVVNRCIRNSSIIQEHPPVHHDQLLLIALYRINNTLHLDASLLFIVVIKQDETREPVSHALPVMSHSVSSVVSVNIHHIKAYFRTQGLQCSIDGAL